MKKMKKKDGKEVNLDETDFSLNAKFISCLANSYFLFEKKGSFQLFFFFQLVLTAYFAFKSGKTHVYPPLGLSYYSDKYPVSLNGKSMAKSF